MEINITNTIHSITSTPASITNTTSITKTTSNAIITPKAQSYTGFITSFFK